ncbi:MAG: S-layer family protein [Cyanobacteria bacterium SBC]|nr:S-layer family protein [Cyanobacteria bacterium SBC]
MQRRLLQGCLAAVAVALSPMSARSQIVPDATLDDRSIVSIEGDRLTIDGGTHAGNQLFHSFDRFDVPENTTAIFNTVSDIQNIFSRVTGNSISHIDGTIAVNGAANLFFLNPNGIVFGENARLDLNGSFFATTANGILFEDGFEYSSIDPQAPPILTVSVPVGVQFGENPGSIVDRSPPLPGRGLQVPSGQSFTMLGGDVRFENGSIEASQGRIRVGSVGENSFVGLSASDFLPFYDNVDRFRDISLSQQSLIHASGVGGGAVQIRGDRVTLDGGSRIESNTLGHLDGAPVEIRARQLQLFDNAAVSTATFGSGRGGDLNIAVDESIELVGNGNFNAVKVALLTQLFTPEGLQGGLFTSSFNVGDSGNILLQAERLSLQEGAMILASTFDLGFGGQIDIQTRETVEVFDSGIIAGTGGTGRSGNIAIATDRLSIYDGGAAVTITLSDGNGGNLTVKARESIELVAAEVIEVDYLDWTNNLRIVNGVSGLLSDTLGAGNGGNIEIETQRLSVRGGGQISAGALGQEQGSSGSITIDAREFVEVVGRTSSVDDPEFPISRSTLSISTWSAGDSGNLSIRTDRLSIRDGANIQAQTTSAGTGGSVEIYASESVEITGYSRDRDGDSIYINSSRLSVNSGFYPLVPKLRLPTGDAGSLRIETDRLVLNDGARIEIDSQLTGNAGNLEIIADRIEIDRGVITARTEAGQGGNISIETALLWLDRNSHLNTDAGNSDGGNISIDTSNLVAWNDSDITANALVGRGGQVNIEAAGIFGTQSRSSRTNFSDITATSELGVSFNGTVNINLEAINPTQGFVELTTTFIDIDDAIDRDPCAAGGTNSRFVNVRRGGLPPSPRPPLSSLELTGRPTEPEFVEAQGWLRRADGSIVLTANVPNVPAAVPYISPNGIRGWCRGLGKTLK